ncbi:MAG: glutathione peroxidase [Rhodobacteraceae bacterium]|nr:glutathione peroxidase [Paracoccaceae bacterium]
MIAGQGFSSINGVTGLEKFEFESIDGGLINLGDFGDQAVLVTNTASNCGFTRQYDELQKLHEEFSTFGLVVLAIPSEDFFQEFSNNDKVKEFCEVNFSLTIPMTTITKVKGTNAHPFYRWLASEHNFRPAWNFNKVLFNKEGEFVDSFGAFTSPNSRKVRSKILELLQN